MAHEDPIPPRSAEEAEELQERLDPETRARRDAALQVVVKTTERAAAVRATGTAVEAAARDRAHREVAFSVDVDPQ